MRDDPLPPELAQAWGNNADLRYRGGNEWSSACPHCNPGGRGGHNPSDRFRMFSTGGPPRAWCRGCDRKFMAQNADGSKPTALEKAQAREAHNKWLREENRRLRSTVARLQSEKMWQKWHCNMSKDERGLWHSEGIYDHMIDTHELGYTIDRHQQYGGAMTIPHKHPKVSTIQYRLMIPPADGDKYRFQYGTKAALFYPWPGDEIREVVLLTEGAKKAMAVWQATATADAFTFRGVDVTIVSSPSKHVPNALIPELSKADLVILMMDPDAYIAKEVGRTSAMERIVSAIGVEKCRHIKTQDKIDDMIMRYDLDAAWFQDSVEQAGPYIMPDPNRKPTTRYL